MVFLFFHIKENEMCIVSVFKDYNLHTSKLKRDSLIYKEQKNYNTLSFLSEKK